MFIYKDGKKYMRKVNINKRGTKYVRFENKDIPVSYYYGFQL